MYNNIYRNVIDIDERWVYVNIMEHVCRDIGQQTCQEGITRIHSFSEQLGCIKQHASHSHVLQFFHLQSIVTCLLVDAVLLMHQ